MNRFTEEQINTICELLKEGKPFPEEYRWLLFEGKQETELIYAGKTREVDVLTETMAVPLQKVKVFGDVQRDVTLNSLKKNVILNSFQDLNKWHNLLIFGDNLQILKTLLKMKEEGKLKNPDGSRGVKLIYIDPPFGTGDIYGRGDVGAYSAKLMGAKYLEWLRQRIILLKELLSDDGSFYIRTDYHFGHYMKVLLDEVFGKENFRNEIVIGRTKTAFYANVPREKPRNLSVVYDVIHWYSKSTDTYYPNLTKDIIIQKREAYWKDFKTFYNRPDKRYKLLGITPEPKCSWLWKKEDAFKATDNYKRYIEEFENKESLEEHWERTGRKLRFLRKEANTVKYWIEPIIKVPNNNWIELEGYSREWDYPTENSEQLLERIIKASSSEMDIVLDAFAGSGTTGAVAEKLKRRWIMIDSSKFAIYTMIKRMLNLKQEIGNKGKPLKPNPFAVYNAGLYDMKMLKELPFVEYHRFALELFQCKDEPHTLAGIELDGYFGRDNVLVFKWKKNKNGIASPDIHRGRNDKKYEYVMDRGFIDNLHTILGDRISKRFFIIAPAASVLFLEDYIEKHRIKYFVLRIPYSIIDELHKKNFSLLEQPLSADISEVNKVMEQVGFDFIYPPDVECKYYVEKPKGKLFAEAVIKITKFRSNIISKRPIPEEELGFKALSMVMIDYDFNGEYFDMDEKWFAQDLEENNYEIRLPTEKLTDQMMIIYMDVWGNERKEVLPIDKFKKT
ncbi:MAG: site-specific DNA-methyltransferase [Candidatus Edwardsbacteria bacterium]